MRKIMMVLSVIAMIAGIVLLGYSIFDYYRSSEEANRPMPTPSSTYSVSPKDAISQGVLNRNDILNGKNTKCPLPAKIEPNHVYIPALCISSGVTQTSFDENNSLILPNDNKSVVSLSDTGVNLLSGHVNWEGDLGTLYNISNLQPGDIIVTTNSKAQKTFWAVSQLTSYNKQALPQKLFDKNPKQLAVITCGGKLITLPNGTHTYEQNVVVEAVKLDK